jgi:hypothetical protein
MLFEVAFLLLVFYNISEPDKHFTLKKGFLMFMMVSLVPVHHERYTENFLFTHH